MRDHKVHIAQSAWSEMKERKQKLSRGGWDGERREADLHGLEADVVSCLREGGSLAGSVPYVRKVSFVPTPNTTRLRELFVLGWPQGDSYSHRLRGKPNVGPMHVLIPFRPRGKGTPTPRWRVGNEPPALVLIGIARIGPTWMRREMRRRLRRKR